MADLISMLAAAAGAAAGGGEVDPNFNQTVLLLHGDGTNGAQNNTFLDSSTNNFTITRNGNTTQGTFSPFSVGAGEWSNYFDGTGDYLSIADNTALDVEASNFTIEFFVYLPATPSGVDVVFAKRASGTYQGCTVFFNGSLAPTMQWTVNGSSWEATTSSVSCVLNQFNHIAFTRNSNTWTIWVNGVSGGSATVSGTVPNNSAIFTIGADTEGSSNLFVGHISNFRLVKGTAVYTSAFTPPTTPLTNITNTSLLTCQSNRFVDNSTNAFAITVNGNTSVQPFSPFAPTAAYSASVNGGSGYFDGTGDFLSIADAAAFDLSNSNFAIEAWVYPLALPASNAISVIASQYITNGSRSFIFALYNNSGTMQLLFQPVSASTDTSIAQNFAFKVGEWAHIAAVRSGNNITLYGNGASLGTTAYSSTIDNATGSYLVGCRYNASSVAELLFTGYIAGHRLIVGSDTAPSGIPTTPPTNVTNTAVLLNFTNAGIFDNTGKNNLETVGNAQIDTTTKKFGTGSMEFDGTGDYLLLPDSDDLYLGSGNFTAECWAYPTASPNQPIIMGQWSGNTGSTTLSWVIILSDNSSRFLRFGLSTDGSNVLTNSISSSALTLNDWNHIALVRNGSVFTAYLNGTSAVTYTITAGTALYNATNQVSIGGASTGSQPFQGYIDDLRITKGVARYTTTFTPPTKAFPDL